MATEAIVAVVVEKIAELIIQEAVFLRGVRDQFEWMKGELRQMKCFLTHADEKQQEGDARITNWVADFRDIAYDAEDVIENFILSRAVQRRRGFITRYASIFLSDLLNRHRVSQEIERIKARIEDISKRQVTYGIQEEMIGGERVGEGSSSARRRLRERRRISPHSDEPDIFGLEEDINSLKGQLINKWNLRRSVISIVGMGGLGKTTLAKQVYNSVDVRSQFRECRAWVYVSQVYNTKEILQDLAKKVMGLPRKESKEMSVEELEEKLHRFLQERRYLVIMDDVWVTDVWDEIKGAFPDMGNGSRIVLTTRSKDVALHADPASPVHELQLLSDENSWALFSKKSFLVGNSFSEGTSQEQLENVGKKIVDKCGGLPLAIVVLGGILSRKERSLSEWTKVLERINWQLDQDRTQCSQILALSYDDLPLYLKPCFLYLGSFPEDSEISARRLIHLWIAEGLVQKRGGRAVEDVAGDYLEELSDRSMVQVVARRMDRTVKKCRVHDLLRDLSISKAKEVEFFQFQGCTSPEPALTTRARRLVLNSKNDTEENIPLWYHYHSCQPRLRSVLLSLNGELPDSSINGLFVSTTRVAFIFGMLRVLDLGYVRLPKLPNEVGKLIHLRYLGLRKTRGSGSFSPSLCNLWNLQTLDVKDTSIVLGRNVISMMQQLRHLYLTNEFDGIQVLDPPRLDYVSDGYYHPSKNHRHHHHHQLQTLWSLGIDRNSRVKDGWDSFINVRKLRLVGDLQSQAKALSFWIAKLNRLESLALFHGVYRYLRDPMVFPLSVMNNHPNLYRLSLNGVRIDKLPSLSEFPPNLSHLTFGDCMLGEEDPFPTLSQLLRLKYLKIAYSQWRTKQMVCPGGGFPMLDHLIISNADHLEEWSEVGKGAFSSLRKLELLSCRNMKMLPDGLQNVDTLRELYMDWMSDEFNARVQETVGEDWYKIAHVPSIRRFGPSRRWN